MIEKLEPQETKHLGKSLREKVEFPCCESLLLFLRSPDFLAILFSWWILETVLDSLVV